MLNEKDFEQISKDYDAKFELLKINLPDYENHSLNEIYAKMDLTDNEIWYLSYLEVKNDDENAEWEGFGTIDPEGLVKMWTERFNSMKDSITIQQKVMGC